MMNKAKTYPLNQSPLFRLRRHGKLAQLLGLPLLELKTFLHDAHLYKEFDVLKKSGGARRVENPKRALKLVQRRLARLLCRIAPPDYLFCPVKGRSYVTNAAQH